MIKIVATRSYLLKLKCTKFGVGWGSAPSATGEFAALPRHFSWIFVGSTSIRKRGKGKREGQEKEERGKRGGKEGGTKLERKGKERETSPPTKLLTTTLHSNF